MEHTPTGKQTARLGLGPADGQQKMRLLANLYENLKPLPVWVDGDPLMETIAAAVYEQCSTDPVSSLVVDDPRNIAAVAATLARQLLGTTGEDERCICGETACESDLCDCDSRTCPADHAAGAAMTVADTAPSSAFRTAHAALAEQAGRDQAALARVRAFLDQDQDGLCCSHVTGQLRAALDTP